MPRKPPNDLETVGVQSGKGDETRIFDAGLESGSKIKPIDHMEESALRASAGTLAKEVKTIDAMARVELAGIEKVRAEAVKDARLEETSTLKQAAKLLECELAQATTPFERDQYGLKYDAMCRKAEETCKEASQNAEAIGYQSSQAARARAEAARVASTERAQREDRKIREEAASRKHDLQKRQEVELQAKLQTEAQQALAHAMRPKPLQIFGAMSGELVCTVLCKRAWSAAQLKGAVAQALDTSVAEFRLLNEGQILTDQEAMDDLLSDGLTQLSLTRVTCQYAQDLEDVADGLVKLDELDELLRGDRDIVLAALRERGWELQFASARLQKDREVVLCAVRSHGEALQYGSEILRRDQVVVLAAVQNSHRGCALEYADKALLENHCFMLKALGAGVDVLRLCSRSLLRDRSFVLEAVQVNGSALRYAVEVNSAFGEDVDVVYEAVTNNVNALASAAHHLRRDRAVSRELSFFQQNPDDLHSARLRSAMLEANRIFQEMQEPE